MKNRYSITVVFSNLVNGVDIEFDSYNDAIHFAHSVYKSPDCQSVDVWKLVDGNRSIAQYSKTKTILSLGY